MISRTISHYNILEVIGEGGMGIVYKARDMNLDRLVALKFMPYAITSDKTLTDQFIREARIISQLEHPNLCTIHEFDKTDDEQFFIVMAYCQGQTLEQILKENGPLPIRQFLDIACQICEGLMKAHQAGIIHRDLKPANIIINGEGAVKILDFGLADIKEDIGNRGGLSAAGTMAYMSPEQIIGNPLDQRSDLWSLGVIMYRMLSGKLPFTARYEQGQTYAILKEKTLPLTTLRHDIPGKISEIIDHLLKKEPDQRIHEAGTILNELEEVRDLEFPSKSPRKAIIRKRLIATTVILFFILSIFITYLSYTFEDRQDSSIRIAVMTFTNLSSETDKTYFSDGVTEEIRSQLAIVKEFRIMSRQAVENFNQANFTIGEITEKLNVHFILDGTIIKNNTRIRIVTHLFDAKTEEIHWTETYDRNLTDIFKVQGDIARDIAAAVKVKLTNAEKKRLENETTSDPTAYDYYLKGGQYYSRLNRQDNEIAIQLYKKALTLDSEFAPAYARLSIAYIHRAMPFGSDLTWYDSARVVAEKAVELDPNCPEAYFALGMLYARVGTYKNASYKKASLAYAKALKLIPNDYRALYLMGQLKRYTGMNEEALDYFKQAIESNPMSAFAYAEMGRAYRTLGKDDLAEDVFLKALEISPDLNHARTPLAVLYLDQGRYDQAITMYEKAIVLNPDHHWHHHDMAMALKNSGYYNEAIASLERALELAPTERWHYLGLANIYHEQDRIYEAGEIYIKAMSVFPNSHIIGLNYSFLLAKSGDVGKAHTVLQSLLNNSSIELDYLPNIILPISKFIIGTLKEDSVNQILQTASKEMKQSRELICSYYYLGMAHLLNLGENGEKTTRDTLKAITHLEKYVSKAARDDVEYSLARAELKKLKSLKY